MITREQAFQLLDRGQLPEAESAFLALLKNDPADGHCLWGLGRLATMAGADEAATQWFARCSRALPGEPEPLIALAEALVQSRHFAQAETAFREAARLHPDYAPARYALGVYLTGAGEFEAAESEFRHTITLQPNHAWAFWNLSRIRTFKPGDPDLSIMEKLHTGATNARHKVLLDYALGKARHDTGDYARAFQHLEQANEQQLSTINYRVADMAEHFRAIGTTFTAQVAAANTASCNDGPVPIFIVGQPRSGSTLLEQMLTRHSAVTSAGESDTIGKHISFAIRSMTGQHFPHGCALLSAGQLAKLGAEYSARLPVPCRQSDYVIDKMPANFQSLGLIRMMLPQARIIHLQRDPMDNCFSIFRNYFSQEEPFFCTQTEIGRHHRFYRQTMLHWRDLFADDVLELKLETMLASPRQQLALALDYCGLTWQEDLLEDTATDEYIPTLSNVQVRGPLTARATPDWEPYGEWLEPLRGLIGCE